MPRNLKLDKALKKQDKKKENRPEILSGELGIPISGNKTVEVPNRRGYVFVRIHGNMSELIQAYNSSVSPIYDLPVLITRQGNVYKVIGRDFDRYQENWGNVPYLPRHGTQHSFNPALNMGADATWVYPQQFMPLLAYPSGTDSYGSMHLAINPDFYSWQGNYYYAQTTGTPDFTPYLPTITGSAVMTLLYIQPSDNSLQIIAGSPFSNQITGSAELAQYIPDIDRSIGIPLAAVRLVTGTTGITWNNIYDVRDFFTIGQSSAGGGGIGFVAQDEGILLGTGTVLNFVGPNVDASISGSVVRVFITGSTGGSISLPATGTFVAQDEGITLGSVTTLNVVSSLADISISGTVARLFITGSPQPQGAIVEDLTPQVSGTNTHFILSQSVNSSGILLLYNGIAQRYAVHYLVSGTFLDTFFTPTSGSLIAVEMGVYTSANSTTLASDRKVLTSGDKTGLASTSFADIDANLNITLTTGARRCIITATAVSNPSINNTIQLDVEVDGTRLGQTFGLNFFGGFSNLVNLPLSFSVTTPVLSAGSHTFKLQYRVDGGTVTIYAHTSTSPIIFSVTELADKVPL